MATKDLTTNAYDGFPALQGDNLILVGKRRLTGAILNAAGTPGSDTFRIAKLGEKQMVQAVTTIVTDADSNAITLKIGHEPSTGTANDDAFETDAALNATGCTRSSIASVLLNTDGWLTITPSGALEAATTFDILYEVVDLRKTVTDTLSDVI